MSNELPGYEDWKRLSPDQRDFLLWQTLRDVNDAPQRYAAKWTERVLWSGMGILAIWVINQLLHLIPASMAGGK